MVATVLDAAALQMGAEKPGVTVRSTGIMDCTPAEFFVRATGDWNMIKEYPDMVQLLKDIGPRPWMNLIGNVGEAHPFMQAMGWMQEGKTDPNRALAPPRTLPN